MNILNNFRTEHTSFPVSASGVLSSAPRKDILEVKFGDGTEGRLPFVWLRDNCQCPQCFSVEAQGRKLLMDDLDIEVYSNKVQVLTYPWLVCDLPFCVTFKWYFTYFAQLRHSFPWLACDFTQRKRKACILFSLDFTVVNPLSSF